MKREEPTHLELGLNFLSAETKVKTDISSDCRSTGDLDTGVEHLEGSTKRLIFNNLKRTTAACYPLNKQGTESLTVVCASSSKIGD